MTRYRHVLAIACAFAAGALLLLLALDVARAERRLVADDARFLAQPRGSAYWRDDGLLPLGLGRRLAGASDDVAHRRAVQRFWRGRPREGLTPTPERLRARAQAQAALAEVADGPGASQTANLLGVLALLTPPEQAERTQVARASSAAFRRAIRHDPTNDDAKFNLESVLRLVGSDRNLGRGGGGATGQNGAEFGGAAVSPRGTGY